METKKITLTIEENQILDINGALLDQNIINFLLDLQQGIDIPGNQPAGKNKGIEGYKESYKDLILFLATEAGNFNDSKEVLSWFPEISAMMNLWNRFRIPETKKNRQTHIG